VPLPSPYTSKVANRHRRANDAIIYVGAASFFSQQRIFAHPRGAKALRYVGLTCDFLANLDSPVRQDVLIRPYGRSAVSIDFAEIVRRDYPDMPILNGDLHAALLQCRLAVLLGYSTTLNLTLAANTPTLIIWQRDFLAPREDARPYFDEMEACGMLHFDAAAAARHINHIADNVEQWWRGADVQRARTRWVERFARTDRFWWWQWMLALSKLKHVA
jgi:putative transferase (TIGR04331 family)